MSKPPSSGFVRTILIILAGMTCALLLASPVLLAPNTFRASVTLPTAKTETAPLETLRSKDFLLPVIKTLNPALPDSPEDQNMAYLAIRHKITGESMDEGQNFRAVVTDAIPARAAELATELATEWHRKLPTSTRSSVTGPADPEISEQSTGPLKVAMLCLAALIGGSLAFLWTVYSRKVREQQEGHQPDEAHAKPRSRKGGK